MSLLKSGLSKAFSQGDVWLVKMGSVCALSVNPPYPILRVTNAKCSILRKPFFPLVGCPASQGKGTGAPPRGGAVSLPSLLP